MNTDIDGDPRPSGESFDIGADEYVPAVNVTAGQRAENGDSQLYLDDTRRQNGCCQRPELRGAATTSQTISTQNVAHNQTNDRAEADQKDRCMGTKVPRTSIMRADRIVRKGYVG